MGVSNVLQKAGQKIAGATKKVGDALADAQNKVSVISPAQLKDIDDKKSEYYKEYNEKNPNNDQIASITNKLLGATSIEIYNAYLSQINELYKPLNSTYEFNGSFNSNLNIRYINITKWVIDKNENSLEKLVNVYEVLSNEECNIALIFNRKVNETNVYLAIVNTNNDKDNNKVDSYAERILEAIKGNFPGSICKYDKKENSGRIPFLDVEKKNSVACISNIPAEKSEKFNTQTIEKLIDGIQPSDGKKEWTLILLATPVLDVKTRKLKVGQFYSALKPYKDWETNYTVTESKADTRGTTVGVNLGGNSSSSVSNSGGGNIGLNIPIAKVLGSVASFSIGGFFAHTVGKTIGSNFGGNFTSSMSQTATIGKNEGITQHFENHTVKHTLELLEEQMKRLEQASALGYWDFAAYVLSEDVNVTNNVAHSYLALTQGEKSYMAEANVNTWRGDLGEHSEDAKEIVEYLKDLRHPIFALNPEILNVDDSYNMYPTAITATTQLSGKELAYSLNFPKKSITGLPVIECAEFGRSVSIFGEQKNDGCNFNIGNIFHMQHMEKNVFVGISKKSLASHTFITGSTGSGKSNTVYQILGEAIKNDVKFMVIEPTKGEYKDIFCVGENPIAKVYGTNPDITPLLKINPFSFPKGIHVFEHMDRLVEIFNVCWPMYAAMPAVLKSAIEKSYIDCGWDLINSTNEYGENLYPNFKDVARNIKEIIESSEYDNENKGAYKGSLLTRLESLTNGINGLLFTENEINLEDLFDDNVVIDISRVGSNETKSLIMGMMVLKLQEYRMSNKNTMNSDLKHLTVLEEAHNLLKRTSTEVSQDSGNLLGKSVEMISNAIAEMRTYGEGFIIVDQAPALLDMAAIRNTNTKIIMRLPDESDRKLVGKAANLNDDQIVELARLPMGVGAIYQNEWIQAVLCKINKYEEKEGKYIYKAKEKTKNKIDIKLIAEITNVLVKNEKVEDSVIDDILISMNKSKFSAFSKVMVRKILENAPSTPLATKLGPIMSELYPKAYNAFKKSFKNSNEVSWTKITDNAICESLQNEILDIHTRRTVVQCLITQYLHNELNEIEKLEKWSIEGGLLNEIR